MSRGGGGRGVRCPPQITLRVTGNLGNLGNLHPCQIAQTPQMTLFSRWGI